MKGRYNVYEVKKEKKTFYAGPFFLREQAEECKDLATKFGYGRTFIVKEEKCKKSLSLGVGSGVNQD